MTRFGRSLTLTLLATALGAWSNGALAQDCLNEDQYPLNAHVPSLGLLDTISTCSFEMEFSVVTGILPTGPYEFTLESGGYITVRQGTFDGPILAQGLSPVTAVAVDNGDLFAHWNVDENCATNTECLVTTVQLLLDCTPPNLAVSYEEDCPNETYTILLDIIDLGDASTVDVIVTTADGNETTEAGLGVGVVELGPYQTADAPNVVVTHDSDPLCTRYLGELVVESLCPNLITCGAAPELITTCFEPSDTTRWIYESVGTGTLRLTFLRGTIDGFGDSLRIYDGADATAPLLFANTANDSYNLGPDGSSVNNDIPFHYAVDVLGTSGSLYMIAWTNGFTQCGGEFPSTDFDEWEWEVACLDCTLPEATWTVADDCANAQFNILVDVASTGDGATVDIVYTINGGQEQTVTGIGVGIAELGPFALNDTINATVVPQGSDLCNIPFGDITDANTCPLQIACGTEVAELTCYENGQDVYYRYQGTGTFPLGIFFDAGQLFFGDSLIIYDGPDSNSPVLFGGDDQNLTELFVNTTNPDHLLTVRIVTNNFTSCQDGFEPEALAWRVSCLDCVPATAAFSVVLDCANSQYYVSVDISDLGSDSEAEITNTLNADVVSVTATGVFQAGPFPLDSPVEVTVVNDANFLCNVESGELVNPVCPVDVDCAAGILEETYCYVAGDVRAWSYQLVGGTPTTTLRLTFLRGTIERAAYDHLRIYDGPDNTYPLLFDHTGLEFVPYELGPEGSAVLSTGGTYYGIDVGASNGTLYMEMTADGSVQCGNGTYDEWEWEVYCIDCVDPSATMNIVPDCVHRQYSAEVIITDDGGEAPLTITNLVDGAVIENAAVGVYTFGPYPLDSISLFRVNNSEYPACRTTGDTLIYTPEDCIIETCGFDNYEYCYENDEDRWYTFRSAQNVPMSIGFLQGQMLSGDQIVVYNGADESVLPPLYQGINGGNLTGFALNSANVSNTITLRIQSNASGSCDDGTVTAPLRWTVACGSVGLTELAEDDFAVFPNPTEGLLQIELGSKVNGRVGFRLLDMSGRIVMEQLLTMNGGTRNTVDLNGLHSGNYIVQLTTPSWVKTQRVEVAR